MISLISASQPSVGHGVLGLFVLAPMLLAGSSSPNNRIANTITYTGPDEVKGATGVLMVGT
jgi:hypothetical protein